MINKMKIFALILLFSIIVFTSYTQERTSVWYFGDNAGLDFKTGAPVPLTDGALATREGCASICDMFGNILFYTEGTIVWNKEHQIMDNGTGLLGDFSSTQSAIIIPKPGSSVIYYIFTVSSLYDDIGKLHYSVVDISKNNGLGKVIQKNNFLHQPIVEKITAVLHSNGNDYWVIAHERYTNTFVEYLVTEQGVNSSPSFIDVGTVHEEPISNWGGYLKASPIGNYLVYANQYPQNLFELLSFNNSTGEIFDPITLHNYRHSYGAEFSPDGTKLYLGKVKQVPSIYQLDLTSGNPDDIINSSTFIAENPYEQGALQLGPDKKIYVSLDFSPYLGVINKPNNLGLDCNYIQDGVYLDGKQGRLGLPNFVSNFFEADFTYNPDCLGDTTLFNLEYTGTFDSISWNFGDPASGENNYSNLQNPFHVFSASGEYIVSVIIYSNGSEYTIEKVITIYPSPLVDLGNDTTICSQSYILLNAGSGFDTYLWQDGSTDSVFLATGDGEYWVRVENNCGFDSDTINIDYSSSFDIDLGQDTAFCYGKTIALSPGNNYYSYYWQDGSSDSVLLAGITGYYWVQVTDSAGCTAIDSVYIETYMNFDFSIGPDTSVICDGDYIFLHGPEGYNSYLWQDGSEFTDMIADTAGIYWLEVSDENNCAARDSALLIVNKVPDNFLGNDTTMCQDSFIDIHAPSFYNNYSWSNGSSDSVITVWETGKYWAYVEDSIGCSGIDTISVSLFTPPTIYKSTDSLVCPGDSLVLSPGYNFNYYLWNTGSTDSAITISEDGEFWVETGTICGIFYDSISVEFYKNNSFSLGPDTNNCNQENLKLSPGYGFDYYLWNNGSVDSVLTVFEKGEYSVTVYDGNCSLSDSIFVDDCNSIWVPNVFTPNGDNYNDYFFAVGENIEKFKMTIFNRWGQVLKVLNSIDEKWDGKYQDQECAEAVYYWVVNYSEIDSNTSNITKELRGSVTLLR